MDKLTPQHRSSVMKAIRHTDTKPEMLVRKLVYSLGYRYRLHVKELPGKPDLTFKKLKKVIFIHGCFWHGHDACKGGHLPKSNSEYWIAKLERNRKRDALTVQMLQDQGWGVLVLWECELKEKNLQTRITSFLST